MNQIVGLGVFALSGTLWGGARPCGCLRSRHFFCNFLGRFFCCVSFADGFPCCLARHFTFRSPLFGRLFHDLLINRLLLGRFLPGNLLSHDLLFSGFLFRDFFPTGLFPDRGLLFRDFAGDFLFAHLLSNGGFPCRRCGLFPRGFFPGSHLLESRR